MSIATIAVNSDVVGWVVVACVGEDDVRMIWNCVSEMGNSLICTKIWFECLVLFVVEPKSVTECTQGVDSTTSSVTA